MSRLKLVWILAFVCTGLWLHAMVVQAGDMRSELMGVFKQLGAASNVSGPSAGLDQAAGYFTGGSVFMRNPVHNAQLANLQLPSYQAGCGGIDLFAGSFSYISGPQLMGMMRNIGSAAATYAFMIGLETMAPQIKNTMSELNDLAQKINAMNINSCQMAATALGAVLPRSEASQHHLCTMIGTGSPSAPFQDYAEARQECGAGGKRDQMLEKASKDPKFKSILGEEFNLAWQVMEQHAFLKGNDGLKSIFMTISGTIVARKNGDTLEAQTYISKAGQEEFLKGLIEGGDFKVYGCQGDTAKCLTIMEEPMHIDAQDALAAKVRAVFISMMAKIKSGEELSKEEHDFLNSTEIPFYKYLNVLSSYKKSGALIDLDQLSKIAAFDLTYKYLGEVLETMQEGLQNLKAAQVEVENVHAFEQRMRYGRQALQEKRARVALDMKRLLDLSRNYAEMETQLRSEMSHKAGG